VSRPNAAVQRIVIVGAPGSGKSTLAPEIGSRIDLPVFERDNLGDLGSEIYRRAVAQIIETESWIFDGFPYFVDDEVYRRANAVIALDYPKPLVMQRVLRRSLSLAIDRRKRHGAHRHDGFVSWRHSDHPVRVAWSKFDDRLREMRTLSQRSSLEEVPVVILRSPKDAETFMSSLPERQ
jgi:adenylate kinase family enzyme